MRRIVQWVRMTLTWFRWYMDASYPSMVAHYLYKLGLVHGHAKIQYTLLSMVRSILSHFRADVIIPISPVRGGLG